MKQTKNNKTAEKLEIELSAFYNAITTLDFSYSYITELPDLVSNCPNLSTLNLFDCPIEDWEQLFERIENFAITELYVTISDFDQFPKKYLPKITGLKVTFENNNQFSDLIQAELFQQLKTLTICGTEQVTKIPESVFELCNLEKLELFATGIEELSTKIENLQRLTTLDLTSNKLKSIPDTITKLTNLVKLTLNFNKLSSLPAGLEKLTRLNALEVEENPLESLPDGYFQHPLILNSTMLHLNFALHTLPPAVGLLTNLEFLDLSRNQIKQLPQEITKLTLLNQIDISDNQFTKIPAEIFELKNLQTIRATNNQITEIPDEIGNLLHLTGIYLTENKLTTLPVAMEWLKNLIHLYINQNPFAKVPEILCKIPSIIELDISGSKIEELPLEMANISNLRTLNIDSTKIAQIPAAIKEVIARNIDLLKKSGEYGWIKDSHDATPYGLDLAERVAGKLESNQNMIYEHRDYCGKGLVFKENQFLYVSVYDGYSFFDEVTFGTRAEFVEWLAVQSDESLAGIEDPVPWMQDNQRITKERLVVFISSSGF